MEHRSDPVDRVGGLPEAEADGAARLLQLLGGDHHRLPIPVIGFLGGRLVHRVHRQDVDAGVLLEEIEPRARRLHLRAGNCRHGDPFAAGLAQELGSRRHLAVLLDERVHHVVERLELARVGEAVPGGVRQDVVTGARLRLRHDRPHVLVALAGDVVDLDVDLLLLAPVLAELGQRVVRPRDPVVPEAERERAGGMRGADVRKADRRGGGGGGRGDEAAAGKRTAGHASPPQERLRLGEC